MVLFLSVRVYIQVRGFTKSLNQGHTSSESSAKVDVTARVVDAVMIKYSEKSARTSVRTYDGSSLGSYGKVLGDVKHILRNEMSVSTSSKWETGVFNIQMSNVEAVFEIKRGTLLWSGQERFLFCTTHINRLFWNRSRLVGPFCLNDGQSGKSVPWRNKVI